MFSEPPKDKASFAGALARYAIALTYEDLPPEVVRAAKRAILDSFGCAIAAYEAPPSRIAIGLTNSLVAGGPASVIGCRTKTSHELAVFANGVMLRYLDFNDSYPSRLGGGVHPSDILAALLSSAEVFKRSGRDLITATVLAYDIACKIIDNFAPTKVGVDHSTVLGLAAVIGAGRLMGLTEQQLIHAIGITVGGNTSINQGRVGALSNWKVYACAEACRKAIFSAELARAGMSGPENIFEGRDGFFNVISRKPFAPPEFGADAGFSILRAITKRFPVGHYSQTVVQAAIELRSFARDIGDVASVNIHVSRAAIKVMADSPDKWRPRSHETADHSMPYSAAVALAFGVVESRHYDDPFLSDQRLFSLIDRIRCVPSDEADRCAEDANLCEMEIVLRSGARKTARVEYPRGHWRNPMTDGELNEKFRSLAGRHMNEERLEALQREVEKLEQAPQAGCLLELTQI